jgi:raffinose/stachyose/melibiose transport system permease protein
MIYMELSKKYPIYFILPALLIFSALFILPTVEGFYYSFTDWNTYAKNIHFIGLGNFGELLKEGILPLALKNTLIYAVFTTLLLNVVGFTLALALNEEMKFGTFFRTVFYMPVVIAGLIVGYIFKAIYNPDFGILNQFIRAIGMDFLARDWLNESGIAIFSIIMTEVWRSSGFCMIIYLAGIKTISKDLLEQSKVDGASYLQKVRHIVFPMIAPTFTVNLLVTMISSLKVFEIVLVLTQGGPGYNTDVINTFIYRNFAGGNWGYASAAGLVQTVIIGIISFVMLAYLRKREVAL